MIVWFRECAIYPPYKWRPKVTSSSSAGSERMVVGSLLALFSFFSKAMAARRERTFICIKPDGVQRNLCGLIIQRFEQKGLKLVAMKFMQAPEELLKQHYIDLANRPFYPGLVKYMASGPVLAMVWEGLNAVKTGRIMLGETNPFDSKPGTVRGDFAVEVGRNICHGSDSVDSAKKEISLWFKDNEVVLWQPSNDVWVYED